MKKLSYFLILICFVLLLFSPFFIKVRIECKSQFGECPSEIKSFLITLKTKNLFDARQKTSSYLKKSFLVTDNSLQFKLPNVLLVQLVVKRPVFALFDKNSNKAALVDINGQILSLESNTTLPVVYIDQYLPIPGANVGAENLFALKIVSGVFEMYQVNIGEIQGGSLVVDLLGQIRVIFPLDGDIQLTLGALKLIYAKTQGDYAGKFSQIDLRFKNPILR